MDLKCYTCLAIKRRSSQFRDEKHFKEEIRRRGIIKKSWVSYRDSIWASNEEIARGEFRADFGIDEDEYFIFSIDDQKWGMPDLDDNESLFYVNCVFKDKPMTYDDYDLFDEYFDEKETEACIEWINTYIKPIKTINKNHTSYGLKHLLERDVGVYMTNNEFKSLMLICGFYPADEKELNWHYRISERPLSKRAQDRQKGIKHHKGAN